MSNGKITRRTALGLIGGGAVLASTETLGFTNVTGERGVNISTAASPSEALLGITDNSGNIGRVGKTAQEVFYLDNNASDSFDPHASDATVISYEGCADCPTASIDLTTADHDYAVVVSCEGTDANAIGPMEIHIRMNGSNVSVDTTTTTENDVEIKCSGNTGGSGGFTSIDAGNVSRNGTQTFAFQPGTKLKKNGTNTVIINLSDADGVDYSNATAAAVGNNGTAQFTDPNTIEFTATKTIQANDTVEIDVDGYMITGTSGETYTAIFSRSGATDGDDFSIS